MADKKISELETATLSDVVEAGYVPVAVPNTGTFKVPVSALVIGGSNFYEVVYGETTRSQIDDALTHGLTPIIKETNASGGYYFHLFSGGSTSNGFSFSRVLNDGSISVYFLNTQDVWTSSTYDHFELTAGDGIDISNDGKISVKLGTGLVFGNDGGVKVISLDTETVEVVEAVQKLENDIDTKLTTNMSMADIDEIYDFADSSTYSSVNGGFLLAQAFTVPINNGLRIDDTLLGVYAKQNYGTPVILGLYEFNFDGNNGTGQTLWVGDTGPVDISAGRNEFPLKHLRATEQELLASRVYYAALYLPASRTASGLLLAGAPRYGATNGNINAIPKFTTLSDNLSVDVTDPTSSIENVGPWSSGYNEHPEIPRFFMQIRNREGGSVVPTDPFDNLASYTLGTSTLSTMGFQTAPQSNGVLFKKVIPNKSVTVKKWSWTDDQQNGSYGFGWLVTDSTMDAITSQNDVTITDVDNGDGTYTHTATHATGIALSNAVYWFPVHGFTSNLLNSVAGVYTGANTDDLRLCDSGYNVQYGTSYDVTTANAFLQLTDSDNNIWTI